MSRFSSGRVARCGQGLYAPPAELRADLFPSADRQQCRLPTGFRRGMEIHMEYLNLVQYIILVLLIVALAAALFAEDFRFTKYDRQGFDKKGFHKNGTKYDDDGYDCFGYDKNGYNREGYNSRGRNARGQYNRFYDIEDFEKGCFSADGFLDPRDNPVAVTDHARIRMQERMGIQNPDRMETLAFDAYRFGRSARQLPNGVCGSGSGYRRAAYRRAAGKTYCAALPELRVYFFGRKCADNRI